MLMLGAAWTLAWGLVVLLDTSNRVRRSEPWARSAIVTAVHLALFAGFYTAKVVAP